LKNENMKTKLISSNPAHFAIFLFIILISNTLFAQVKISEENWVLPTYPVEPPDKNPMFFKGESYQGVSKAIYPYALNDMISNSRLLVSLGYKGLGDEQKAKENLELAVGLSVSNLWAAVEREGL